MTLLFRLGLVVACALSLPLALRAQSVTQPTSVTLEQALAVAEQVSEDIGIASAAVVRARGDQVQANSQFLPQINGSVAYTRTLHSQYQGAFSGGAPDTTGPSAPPGPCDDYLLGPSATDADRLQGLEDATRCANGSSAFSGLGNLGFGAANQYDLGVQFSQPLYAGGRLSALRDVSAAGVRTAEIALDEARAQLRLNVAQAYLDAALMDRLVAIADSSLAQTDAVLTVTRAAKEAGDRSEFELLRAQVARDNQRPVALQQRTARDLAYLRLKQMLNLPYDTPLQLLTVLQDSTLPEIPLQSPDTSVASRSTVREAAELVNVQRSTLKAQQAQRLPAVGLTSRYGRVAYPAATLPDWSDFRTNWTVGVGVQVPLFTGGRIRGQQMVAQANLDEAQLRLTQVSKLSALDARSAAAQLADAQAAWDASRGTVEQANQAYSIAEVRYREGISTQVELSESRILLQQSQAVRAQAARDLQVARIRLALLRDLPVGAGLSGAGGASASSQQSQQAQPSAALPSFSSSSTGATSTSFGGAP